MKARSDELDGEDVAKETPLSELTRLRRNLRPAAARFARLRSVTEQFVLMWVLSHDICHAGD